MIYFHSFLIAGIICMIGEIILDHSTLTAGHVTTLFVIIGSFLDNFNLYDKIILWGGGGALVPITSFGHLLIHGAMARVNSDGLFGLFMGMFDLTSSGITSAIIISFFFCLLFNPKD
jgi:stage V sporulation protein AE